MLTVLATATEENLTTLENAKEALKLTDPADDEYLKRLIRRASRRIETYLGRPLALQTYQAIVPAYGNVNLQLPRYPVHAVGRVFDGSDTAGNTELSATEYRLDKGAGHLNRDAGWVWTAQHRDGSLTRDPVPGAEARDWLIEFSAGYVLPNGTSATGHYNSSTGPTLPGDIEEACLELVKDRYLSRTRHGDVQSERVGDVSVTYREGAGQTLPKEVVDMLAPYRSVF